MADADSIRGYTVAYTRFVAPLARYHEGFSIDPNPTTFIGPDHVALPLSVNPHRRRLAAKAQAT